jgi:hypothetical protein
MIIALLALLASREREGTFGQTDAVTTGENSRRLNWLHDTI